MEWYIGTEWKNELKGLSKKVLTLNFTKLDKPHLVSKVVINVEEVQNLNGRESKYLNQVKPLEQTLELEMGTAMTLIDYYIELLVREMLLGERSRCTIRTKSGEEIIFILSLEKILKTKEIFKLSVKEMYDLALRYKENGVAVYKTYPKLAHQYFSLAAKFLISYKPFTDLDSRQDGVSGKDMQALLYQIKTNLAACLLQENRNEDVIYQTEFVNKSTESSNEKAIFRRATAFVNMNEFESALELIEKVENYKNKKDFAKLYQRTKESYKGTEDDFRHVAQRMFS